ncbi:DUF3577 domain-containing protein [Salmonella enterica subsp. enterica]|nr:DUF3577 domain-containing protein [Salmonella enterica subsp. enterica]MIF51097.1 DUF3577 domain-containing protein [Salmonella enterica subsp. enterica]
MNEEKKYFDLHTRGIGYISRLRTVTPKGKKSASFLACSIAALRGDSESKEYTYFDVKICGQKAIETLKEYADKLNKEQKVFASFVVGDAYPEVYTNKKGELCHYIKGRLLKLPLLRIDGKEIYREPKETPDENHSLAA